MRHNLIEFCGGLPSSNRLSQIRAERFLFYVEQDEWGRSLYRSDSEFEEPSVPDLGEGNAT